MDAVVEWALNAGLGVFAILFIALLAWVLRTNDAREKRYIDTIEQLTEAVGDVQDIKEALSRIEGKLE